MAKCLVLGSNGFIGSHLVDELIKNGDEVRAFDRFGERPVSFIDNERIEKFTGNFLNRGDLDSGEGVSLSQLIEVIKNVTQRDVQMNQQPKPPTFVQKVVLDINLLKSEFNIAPETSLEEGIRKTWQYVLESQQRN
jgi:nucleoside-diphosphate-sugar epimerase